MTKVIKICHKNKFLQTKQPGWGGAYTPEYNTYYKQPQLSFSMENTTMSVHAKDI